MRLPRTSLGAACLAVVFSLASCQGGQEVCAPTDPLCGNGGGGGGVQVASVTVTSSIDSVVAVGGPQATMTAEARDASNNLVSVTFTWSSVTTSTGTVDSSTGVVTALAAGTTTIRAVPDNGSVVGAYTLRAVNADLPGVDALLSDPFLAALTGALGSTPGGSVGTLLSDCDSHVTSGNIRAIDSCLNNLLAVSGSDGTDDALLGVMNLFFSLAQSRLRL